MVPEMRPAQWGNVVHGLFTLTFESLSPWKLFSLWCHPVYLHSIFGKCVVSSNTEHAVSLLPPCLPFIHVSEACLASSSA